MLSVVRFGIVWLTATLPKCPTQSFTLMVYCFAVFVSLIIYLIAGWTWRLRGRKLN